MKLFVWVLVKEPVLFKQVAQHAVKHVLQTPATVSKLSTCGKAQQVPEHDTQSIQGHEDRYHIMTSPLFDVYLSLGFITKCTKMQNLIFASNRCH